MAEQLAALAQALLERETLYEEEILEVTGLALAPPLENTKIAGNSRGQRYEPEGDAGETSEGSSCRI